MPAVSFWSRARAPLLLGAAACGACCAVPLAAVVIGAGAATTAAAILEPLAGVLIGVAAVAAVVAYLRHRRAATARCELAAASCGPGAACCVPGAACCAPGAASGESDACAIDRSCGCGPAPPRRDPAEMASSARP